jgi:alpha-tubulin suppressor-like RCC1 family protein
VGRPWPSLWLAISVLAGCTAQWDDTCTGVAELGGTEGTFAIRKTDGSFWYWGNNGFSYYRYAVERPRPRLDVATGKFVGTTTCIAEPSGEVSCPLLSDLSGQPLSIPSQTSALAVYDSDVCAISASSRLVCPRWADGDFGDGFSRVARGRDHLCAVRTTGAITCHAPGSNVVLPEVWSQSFDEVTGAVDVVATAQSSCVLTNAGAVSCWGSSDDLGRDAQVQPKVVEGLDGHATALVAGYDFVCALLEDGGVSCWGRPYSRLFGVPEGTATRIQGLRRPVRVIAATQSAVCVVFDDTSVWCWGRGPLGDGTSSATDGEIPRPVLGCG